jgi:DNA-binding NtrC family response regulator
MERQRRILLIDGDVNVRQALGEALTDENYEVALAANGPEAMRHLRPPQQIDAVLLDLHLGPDNGWMVLSHLLRMKPGLPVIVMTGARGEVAPLVADAAVMVIEKPLDLRRLFETLRLVTAERDPVQQRIGFSPVGTWNRSAA